MNLKLKLDRIYDEVYAMNENNADDQRIIIAGFEDAVNEGIGKWLGKIAGGVASAPSKIGGAIRSGWDKVSKKTADLYQKGTELGKKVVTNVKDWFKETGAAISKKLGEWGDRIKSGWQNFKDWCKDTFDKLGKSIVEFWEATKEKGGQFIDAIGKFWSDMKEKIKKAYATTIEKFASWGEGARKWVKENYANLKEWSKEKYEGAVEFLRAKYDAALEFIVKKSNATGNALKKAMSAIATWVVLKPYTWILTNVKKIPALYESFKKWLQQQANEFKLGFEETAGRPWDRSKGYMIPPTFPDVNLRGDAKVEEDPKSNYNASKDAFSLGEGNAWKELGLPKRTPKGRSIVTELIKKLYELTHDDKGNDLGLKDSEKALAIGGWFSEKSESSDLYRKSTIATENQKEVEKEVTDEQGNSKKVMVNVIDEQAVGEKLIDIINKVTEDPRLYLYHEGASPKKIDEAIQYMISKGMLDQLVGGEKDLAKQLRDRGMSDNAITKLIEAKRTQKPAKKSMPLPEVQFGEGMKYIKTFERFKN